MQNKDDYNGPWFVPAELEDQNAIPDLLDLQDGWFFDEALLKDARETVVNLLREKYGLV
jgi:hypothetical protein